MGVVATSSAKAIKRARAEGINAKGRKGERRELAPDYAFAPMPCACCGAKCSDVPDAMAALWALSVKPEIPIIPNAGAGLAHKPFF